MMKRKDIVKSEQKYFYIMVSATGTKLGRLIRMATRAHYNHVAVSFDEKMTELWAFARIHYYTPFIGGLVREARYRYTLGKGRKADIKVYRIPVSHEEWQRGRDWVREIYEDDEYAYNLVSAATFWLRHGVVKYKTFTCSEFASHLLELIRPDLAFDKPHCKVTPSDFAAKLAEYEIFSGDIAAYDGFYKEEGEEEYFLKFGRWESLKMTARYLRSRYARRNTH